MKNSQISHTHRATTWAPGRAPKKIAGIKIIYKCSMYICINLNISFFQLYTIVKLKSSAIKVELNFRWTYYKVLNSNWIPPVRVIIRYQVETLEWEFQGLFWTLVHFRFVNSSPIWLKSRVCLSFKRAAN